MNQERFILGDVQASDMGIRIPCFGAFREQADRFWLIDFSFYVIELQRKLRGGYKAQPNRKKK
jgi:hypothetical protein